ncbi:glycosyltransferase family 2 protein [Pseudooceanicola sp. MF1-13]|uniref:glycosyltransferase family 2 protein n=1 Tax=Pseudooceanicola sp. MF1-13 TaxID=3379095 RepID=UPI0038926C36
MSNPAVSVIVVSKGRGDSLALTLTGLARLLYDSYEIIVVADAEGLETVRRLRMEDQVKTVAFADPNISLARNVGIAIAAGELVAFIDDDAVPEPTWLNHLTAPFADMSVAAAGGYVIGRNGISFQWTARSIDYTATDSALNLDGMQPTVLTPPPGSAIKTEGTNMAFRRSDLARIGGFDPAYRFYLDEADLNMRLAKARKPTAIVPLAQVHHAFAPSVRRDASRAPRDLFEIGASLMVYLRRHCPEDQRDSIVRHFRKARDKALIDHMIAGRLEPRDVRRLRRRLRDGIKAGQTRDLHALPSLPHSTEPFLAFETRIKTPGVVLSGRSLRRRALRAEAEERADRGESVSLFLFSPTTLYHRVRMTRAGVWEQRGGIWGKSLRSGWMIRPGRFKGRVRREIARVAAVRGIPRKAR